MPSPSVHSRERPQRAVRAARRPADVARQLEPLLVPALRGAGFDLEELTVSAAGRRSVVRVVVDRDGGVDLDAVALASRTASDVLDGPRADAALPGAYTLEVTSPGVDRPLTRPRHWRRAVGRLVVVRPRGGAELTGRVLRADDVEVVLDDAGMPRTLALAEVQSAAVQVEFRRPGSDEDKTDSAEDDAASADSAEDSADPDSGEEGAG